MFIIAVDASIAISPLACSPTRPTAPFHPPPLVDACDPLPDPRFDLPRSTLNAPLWWRLPVPPQRNSTFADLIEDEPTGVRWHTPAETERLLAMMTPGNLAKVEAAKRAGKRMVGGLYRRMRAERGREKVQRAEVRFDDVAGCLRMPTGGSSRQTVVIVEGASVRSRLLSPREAARLMGLPDDYVLPENYNDAYGLMADGVCRAGRSFHRASTFLSRSSGWRTPTGAYMPKRSISGLSCMKMMRANGAARRQRPSDGQELCALPDAVEWRDIMNQQEFFDDDWYAELLDSAAAIVVAYVYGCRCGDCWICAAGFKKPVPDEPSCLSATGAEVVYEAWVGATSDRPAAA